MGLFTNLLVKTGIYDDLTLTYGAYKYGEYKRNFMFSSYAHADRERVIKELNNLSKFGINVWYDQGIRAGMKLDEEIYRAIDHCSCFAVFISKKSIKRPWVLKEVKYAKSRDKIKIVPVFLDKIPEKRIPEELKSLTSNDVCHINLYTGSGNISEERRKFAESLESFGCAETVKERIDWLKAEASKTEIGFESVETQRKKVRSTIRKAALISVFVIVTLAVMYNNYLTKKPTGDIDSSIPTVDSNYAQIDSITTTTTTTATPILKYYVGDTLTLGTYEQDGNISNGKEDVEWIVIAVEGDKALVLSKYALKEIPYHTDRTNETWSSCSLRSWMNDDFYNSAFTKSEQSQILTSTLSNDNNPDHGTSGGNITTDKIFCLSVDEAQTYLTKNQRIAEATANCILESPYAYSLNNLSWWWLRTPGMSGKKAAYVSDSGGIGTNGNWIDLEIAVRPAMYISRLEQE